MITATIARALAGAAAGIAIVACSGQPGSGGSAVGTVEDNLGVLEKPVQPGEQGCGPQIHCDDGNPCTVDSCVRGTGCVHTPADGAACDDGNACTQTDTCQAGACVGSSPVVCTASDACHLAGSCDPTTGSCSTLVAPDGTACGGGSICQTGVCTSQAPQGPNASGCGASLTVNCPTVKIGCVGPGTFPAITVPTCSDGFVAINCTCTTPTGATYTCNFGRGPEPGTYSCSAAEFSFDGTTIINSGVSCSNGTVVCQ